MENLEVARLENILIFKIDDEPILGVNTSNYSNTPRLFIALNLWQKNKSKIIKTQIKLSWTSLKNAFFIANSFFSLTMALADTLYYK